MNRPWSDLVFRLFDKANRKKAVRANRPAPRLSFEHLEDRVVPATTITVIPGAIGAGTLDGFLSATDGTINATDSLGVAGSVSQGALQAVGSGIQISVTAENSIIFRNDLMAPVALQTITGNSAQFIGLNGSITFQDQADSLTTAGGDLTFAAAPTGVVTLGGLTTSGGNVTIIGDAVALTGTVNVGASATGSIVTIRPFTDNTAIDLGTETGGQLSLTNAELNQITARIVRVGSATAGNINVSAPITLGANVPTLSLISGDNITQAVAGVLTLTNLRVSATNSVQLDDAANDVAAFAGAVTAVNSFFEFRDANGFVITTVDGVAGLSTSAANSNSNLSLTSGGAVTQAAGANITTFELELLGAGSYFLDNVGNNAVELAANLTAAATGFLIYTDADALTIATAEATSGVTTNNANISVRTVNGNLTIEDDVTGTDIDAGIGTVTLTAQSTGTQNNAIILLNNGGAGIIGGGVVLTADNISLADTVAAGANTVTLQPFQAGTLIDLGGADVGGAVNPGTLGLTDAELDLITAGIIRVGNATAGNLGVSAQINPTGTSQLELVTGGSIIDNNSTNPDITVTRLGLTASTGVGLGGTESAPLDISVSNVEATTATGGVFLANTGLNLTIGGVNGTLTGVRTTTSGDISISNNTTISVGTAVAEGISTAGGGSITVTTSSDDINITATSSGVAATGGNGNIGITAEDNVNVAAAISAVGTGDITITAEPGNGAGTFMSTAAGTVTAELGDISITAADNVNVGGAVAVTAGTGTITIIAEPTVGPSAAAGNFTSTGTGTLTTAGGNISIRAGDSVTVGAGVTAGGAGTITIDADAAIDNIGTFTSNAGGKLATAGGTATITAFDVAIGDTINVTTGATSIVTLTPRTNAAVVNLGTNTAFGVTDTELDLITAGVLRIGTATTGAIQITGQVSLDPSKVPVLHLTSATGAITDNTVGEQDDITVQSLALSADSGVGSLDDLNLAVTNLAINNASNNNVRVTNNMFSPAGTLNITTVDGVTGVTNGNPAGGVTTITNIGAMNVLQPVVNVGTGTITLTATGDVTLAANVTAPFNSVTITTPTNIIDDGVDTTVVTAGTNILLSSGGRMGGSTPITTTDVESASTASPTAAFRSALDVSYGGNIFLTQTGALGNVEIRKVGAPLNTNSVIVTTPASFVGNNNQFALISAGGALTVNSVFTVNGANNANLLLATTGGSNLVFNAGSNVINNGNSTTALAATGTAGAAIITPAGDGNPEVQVQSLILDTTGGAIGSAGSPLEFNTTVLNGQTTGLVNGVVQAGGTAVLTDTSNGLTIGLFNAGTGNVTLTSLGNITPTGSSIIGASPNDGIAEIIGNVVTLAATGATTGDGGQIGFFTTAPQFFEVNATTLNASTVNSRLWISDVAGGVAVGSGATGGVNAGTNTAFLRVRNGGNLTGPAPDGTADIVAATINLSAPEGGNFGSGTPLEIDATTALVAAVTGTGNINLRDTAGGLTVQRAVTGTGNVTLDAAGAAAAMVLGNASSTTVVVSASGTATLTATGSVTSGITGSAFDVVAATLNVSNATGAAGIGTGGAGGALDTAVNTFSAATGTGGVFIRDNGALALNGVTATGGNIAITTTDSSSAADNITVNTATAVSTTGAGTVTLTADDDITVAGTGTVSTGTGLITLAGDVGVADAAGTTITVGGATALVSTTPAQFTGGGENDTFNLRPQSNGTQLSIAGNAPATAPGDVLNLDLTGLTPTVTPTAVGGGTVTSASGLVTFSGIERTNFTGTPVALTLDLTPAGFNGGFQDGNASPDVVNASVTAGVLNITVQSDSAGTPLSFFSGDVTGVSSLTVTGSTDRETVIIDETNMPAGLPIFVNAGNPTTAPGDTLVVITTNTTSPVFTPGMAAGAGAFTFGNRAAVTFTGIESVVTAIVSIAVTDGSARETGALQGVDTARFTLTRQGDLTNALTVTYTLGGSAVNGVDYAALPGSVTFAAGSATAVIEIIALNNSRIDGTRTVTLTLTAGPSYTLAANPTASASILDNDAPVSRIAVSKANSLTFRGRQVAVFDNGSSTATLAGDPFPDLRGTDVQVAVGDVDGDGIADVVATEVFRGNTLFRVFDGATLNVRYTKIIGGVGPASIAVGDTDGDGRGEIVLGLTKSPAFGVFDGVTGGFRYGVNAYPGAAVGISVATGDVDGDGKAEIITAPNGVAPLVRVFNGAGGLVREFFAFDPRIAAVGATVAAGDLNGDGTAEIIVGANALRTNFALTFNGNGALRTSRALLPATNTISKFGPPVAAADVNGDGLYEVLVTVGPALGTLDGQTLAVKSVINPFPGFNGGIYLG